MNKKVYLHTMPTIEDGFNHTQSVDCECQPLVKGKPTDKALVVSHQSPLRDQPELKVWTIKARVM